MVLPRGSESWRRMSRFRRQSLVKPLAAEVLEPRCLMTDALGAGLPTPPLAAAAPLTGAVVVDASLWDDAGLTLQQIGDLLHVFRTGTQTDVITPMLARQITSLDFIGRDNGANVLTVHLPLGLSLGIDRFGFERGLGYSPCRVYLERVRGARSPYSYFGQGSGIVGLPTSFRDSGTSVVAPVDGDSKRESPTNESSDRGNADSIDNESNQEAVVDDIDDTEFWDDVPRDNDAEWESVADVLLIGQGIGTVGIEDREWAEFETASSDSAFGELVDSEPDDLEGSETLADSSDLADDGDFNFTDVGEGLVPDTGLSDDFLETLGETPLES